MEDNLQITDILALEELQEIQDLFSDATGVASVITTPKGEPITSPSNFCRLCSDIIRKTEKGLSNCFKSDAELGSYNSKVPIVRTCLSGGLWDAGASIMVGDLHVASWLIGQVKNDELDEEKILQYADTIGADKTTFREALDEVPVMSREKFQMVANLLYSVANKISQVAYQNYKLRQSIDEAHIVEKELRTSEESYRLLFEMNQAGIYRSTINGKLLECNERFAKILGYDSVDEIMKFPTSALYFTNENREDFIEHLRTRGYLSNSELMMKSKQGVPVWILENVMFIESDDPGLSIIQGTCIDITQRKEIEKDLKESEAKYRMLVENAFDGIYLMRGRKYDYVNEKFSQITGYSFAEVTSPNFDFGILLTDKSRKVVEDRYNSRKRGEAIPNQYEIEIRDKEGAIKYVIVSTVVMSDNGEVAVTGIMHDITHRKIAEKALWESEERLNLAVSCAKIGLWDQDFENDKVVRNDLWSEMLGYDPGETNNNIRAFNDLLHPEDIPDVNRIIREHELGGSDEITLTHRLKTKDGKWKWILNTGKVVKRDAQGNPLRALGVHLDVDAHKRAEDALKLSEKTYRGIINSVADAIFIQDAEGRFLDLNIAAELMYGAQRSELIGKTPDYLAFPEKNDITVINQHIKHAYEGASNNIEFWGRRKNGEMFVKDVSLTPGEYFGKKVVIAIARDITERKRSEEALKISDERYRTFINAADDMVFIKDEKLRYVVVNKKNVDFFQKNEDDIIGKTDFDLMPADSAEQCQLSDLQVIAKKSIVITSEQIGDRIYETRKFPLPMKVGETGVGAFIRDITEKVEADKRLQANEQFQTLLNEITTKALDTGDSEELFKVLSEQISQLFNADGCYITLWNEETKQTLPYISSALSTTQYQSLAVSANEVTMTESVLRAEKPLIAEDVLNTPYLSRRIAILFPIRSLMGLPMMVANKKLGAILIAFNSPHKFSEEEIKRGEMAARQISLIVDKMRIVEDLKKNEENLIRLDKEKDRFFSIIAHDIKSPFSAFLGLTEIMAEDFDHFTLKEIQSFILTMRNSASNLYRLLENLLEWSRVQRGVTEFNPTLVLLAGVVNESCELLQHAASKKEINVKHEIPENFKVFADIHMLETILRNLTSNALKFTRKGGRITISAKLENGIPLVLVEDSGIGMSPETITNLFRLDINTSRPGTDNEPSTGLGLILCKEFVEKHGGKIWVESKEGAGSKFSFMLPFEI